MRTPYNKLIRDSIPAIIAADGRAYSVEQLDEAAYCQALRAKLVEEAQEVAGTATEADETDALVTELADLFEVVDALLGVYGLTQEQVRSRQAQRHAERGGFAQRLRLLWTE